MSRSLFAFLLIPVFFAACSQNNVTEDTSLHRSFDSAGVRGAFGLFDNSQGHFTIYNLPRFRDSAYQPAATFDIVQALIAIQTGVVKDDSAIVTVPQGPTLRQSFQQMHQQANDSTFRELSKRIGKDTLKKWIDSLGYGTKYIAGDAFWYDNHLKITADEQLGLIKKLYFGQLPFFQRTQKMVADMMVTEGNSNYQLRYKLAQGFNEGQRPVGWVLGWIEENKNRYFFVLTLESADASADLSTTGLALTHSILTKMGFFLGKR
jgi:beta-lactamase class D